jgi:PhzF family phenazine biosynthesis protein
MKSQLQFVDTFTQTPGLGNRAGVLLDASGLTAIEMQAISIASGVSETAFGFPSTQPNNYDLEVRYFSRARELPICGHATIAFHYLRAQQLDLPSQVLRVKTGVGILPVEIVRTKNDLRAIVTQSTPQVLATLDPDRSNQVLAALGLTSSDRVPELPIQVVSTGHAKVLIPIRSYQRLNQICPDLDRLLALSPLAGANGFFVFTLDRQQPNLLYHGRMFAPATGVDEDAVTGNANGPTGYYLFQQGLLQPPASGVIHYQAMQGESMGSPGTIEVLLHLNHGTVEIVQISGRAVNVNPSSMANKYDSKRSDR